MKHLVKSALARMGYEMRKIESAPQKRAEGVVVSWPKGDAEISFYMENRFDLIGKDLYNGRFYEEEELAYLKSITDPDGCITDIGANIGNHTVYFAAIIGAQKVVAFEPGTWAHPRLCFNVALNGLTDRVQIHKVALSDEDGEAWMDFMAEDNHGTLAIGDTGQGERVAMHRGDTFLAGEKVSLIKIDAERHEMQVLRGLTETLSRSRPTIVVEVLQEERREMEQFFSEIGYATIRDFERYGDIVNLVARPA